MAVDETVVTTTTSNENNGGVVKTEKPDQVKSSDVVRKLSEQFKVNLFTEDGVTSLLDKFAGLQTENTDYKTKLDEKTNAVIELEKKALDNQIKIEALGLGFMPEKLDEVIALAKVNMKENQTLSDGLKSVKEKYANVFTKPTQIGSQFSDLPGGSPNGVKTEQEKYMAKSPAYIAWQNQQKLKK